LFLNGFIFFYEQTIEFLIADNNFQTIVQLILIQEIKNLNQREKKVIIFSNFRIFIQNS